MRAMVLAAGVGSRLDPLTTQIPKPLVPIANRPVMEHIYGLLRQHGIISIISNLHYQPDKIKAYFGDGSRFGIDLSLRFEAELSGDAGGVRACRDFLADGTFLVLMGDLLTDADISAIVAQHKAKRALATIAIKEVPDVRHFGVVVTDQEGFITGFQEKPSPEEALSNHASTGIYVLEPAVFDYIPREGTYGFGRQLFPSLVQQGLPVLGVRIDQSYWSDVGTIYQYRQSNFDALSGLVRLDLPGVRGAWGHIEEGSTVADDVEGDGILLVGKNSCLGSGVKITGRVLIGDNCLVQEGAQLHDTIIWSDSSVGPGASLSNCVVGSNCVVENGSAHNEIASVSWPPPQLCNSI